MNMLAVFAILPLLSGCAYLADRGRDAQDIFTVGIGVGAGATARIGPFGTGMGGYEGRAGLVGGEWYANIGKDRKTEYCVDDGIVHFIILGADGQSGNRPGKIAERGKEYDNTFIGPIAVQGVFMKDGEAKVSPAYYSAIEMTAALGGGVKFGFNPGELIDFMVGWFGLDMYGDDASVATSEALRGGP